VLVTGAALAALGLFPLARLLSAGRDPAWWPGAVHEWLTTAPVLFAISLLIAMVFGPRLDRWGARIAAVVLRPRPRVFAALAATLVVALTAAFAAYCFARAPYGQDEIAQRFHARVLLGHHLAARGEVHPEFFSATGVLDVAGRWYSMYPVGGPAVLALGMSVGAAWLVNPVLTGLTLWNLYRFTRAAWGEGTARAGVLLFAASPFVLIMGASQMNHVATLTLATLALAALPAWSAEGATMWPAAQIGFAVGAMAAIRPLDAALIGGVIGLFQLDVLRRGSSLGRWRSLAAQFAAAGLPLAFLLYANARSTGHPFHFAYSVLNGPAVGLGFHDDPYGVPFTPARALLQTSLALLRLDRYLFEWPLPGLLPIVAALFALRRPCRWDLLLVGVIGAVVVGYGLYWFDGFFAGPRFLYTAVPAFVILTARAPGLLAGAGPALWRRTAFMLLPLCVGYAWAVPAGVFSVRMDARAYHATRTKLKTDIAGQVAAARLPPAALVFVHEGWRARLQARLRGVGLEPGQVERILNGSDACRVQTALDDEAARPGGDDSARRTRLVAAVRTAGALAPAPGRSPDETIFLSQPASLTAACQGELAADSAGDTPFPPFLALETFERDGSLGGPIVFARDFGARNQLLRERFPGRTWFRYRPRRGLDDTTTAIVPY
jgi:hypothetical protein